MPTRSSVHGRENKDVSTAGTLKGDSELTTVGSMSKAKQYYLKQSRYLPGEHRWVLALPVTTTVTSPQRVQEALLRLWDPCMPLGSSCTPRWDSPIPHGSGQSEGISQALQTVAVSSKYWALDFRTGRRRQRQTGILGLLPLKCSPFRTIV